MKARAGLVVIGGGQAGFQVAASARAGGFDEPIVIVAAERELPYQRPPLSKAYLLGKQARQTLAFQQRAFFDSNRIDLRLGCRAERIDRRSGTVALDDGSRLAFDWLVIATGAQNRKLRGASPDGVLSLRDLRDADELMQRMQRATQIVVVGGGFIGLEFAAVARALGKEVAVVELQPRLMARAVPGAISSFVRSRHEQHGVRFRLGAVVESIEQNNGRVTAVRLSDGSVEPADLALVGIGVAPDDAIAADSGLEVADGILVDASLRTSDPHILAIGDCACFPAGGGRHRLESVQNAIDQGKHAARTILGSSAPYATIPWFWSDQNDIRLQMAGLRLAADDFVVRGDPDAGRFSVFAFRRGVLVGAHSVNHPADHAAARKLLEGALPFSSDEAADLSVDLRNRARPAHGIVATVHRITSFEL